MNKVQRGVLIATGLIIASVQTAGILANGLDDSHGWALSFLIAVSLLFVGLGTWPYLNALPGRRTDTPPRRTLPSVSPPPPPAPQQHPDIDKPKYGIHISELDIAIRTVENYAKAQNLYQPLQGNGKSLKWNSCAFVYASMRYAARKTDMKLHNVVWNTIVRSLVVRMTTDEVKGVGMGDAGYKNLERDAYDDVERLDKAVDAALDGGSALEPLIGALGLMFGTRDAEPFKALKAAVYINAENANQKVLPELLETFR
jgi:hypothetical protein